MENETSVVVSWRDELGVAYVEVNGWGISFLEGVAYFSDLDEKEYRIPVENLIKVAFK